MSYFFTWHVSLSFSLKRTTIINVFIDDNSDF